MKKLNLYQLNENKYVYYVVAKSCIQAKKLFLMRYGFVQDKIILIQENILADNYKLNYEVN